MSILSYEKATLLSFKRNTAAVFPSAASERVSLKKRVYLFILLPNPEVPEREEFGKGRIVRDGFCYDLSSDGRTVIKRENLYVPLMCDLRDSPLIALLGKKCPQEINTRELKNQLNALKSGRTDLGFLFEVRETYKERLWDGVLIYGRALEHPVEFGQIEYKAVE